MNKNIVVLGGGIPGIFSALYLSKLFPKNNIHLIESTKKIGGLYNSIDYPFGGIFDKGMHLIYETCISEIDDLIRESMPANEWLYLSGNYKDIAGVYYNNRLETKSPYININSVNKLHLNNCLLDLFKTFENQAPSFLECKNALEFFDRRFGTSATKKIFEPIVKKLWRTPLKKLHPSSTRIVLMDRIRIFSEDATLDLMKSDYIRSRVAFPDQMKLDLGYRNSQRGLYPKQFGMSNLIFALEKKLNQAGVIVHKSTLLSSINLNGRSIETINFKKEDNDIKIDQISLLHSTIASSRLSPFFNLKVKQNELDKSLVQKYVFMLLNEPPKMSNLYYFFSFQKDTKIYRVTNYAAYCPTAKRYNNAIGKYVWPICIELHYKNDNRTSNNIIKDAKEELLMMKIITSYDQIEFSKAEAAGGFPLLTLKNCKSIEETNTSLKNLKIENLLIAGQSPEKGVFFLHDSLVNIYNLINQSRD